MPGASLQRGTRERAMRPTRVVGPVGNVGCADDDLSLTRNDRRNRPGASTLDPIEPLRYEETAVVSPRATRT